MNDELYEALQDQWKAKLPHSDYVFQNRAVWKDKEGKTVRRHPNYGDRYTARRRFMRGLCKKAGIDKRIGFHALRRFFASMLADNREKLGTIQKLLGHANVSTTDRYIHRLKDDTRAAVKKIDFKKKAREKAREEEKREKEDG
jgi:integrase